MTQVPPGIKMFCSRDISKILPVAPPPQIGVIGWEPRICWFINGTTVSHYWLVDGRELLFWTFELGYSYRRYDFWKDLCTKKELGPFVTRWMESRGISLKKIMYALTKIIKNKTKKKSRKIKIIKKNLVHFFRVIHPADDTFLLTIYKPENKESNNFS